MLRSRAFVVFGGFWAAMALTASARSQGVDVGAGTIELTAAVLADVDGPPDPWAIVTKEDRSARPLVDLGDEQGEFDEAAAAGGEACPPEMVEVEGEYCPYVVQKCVKWIDPETKLQCAEFDRAGTTSRCPEKTQHKRFCIDRYEWPNHPGVMPEHMANWNEARVSCESVGKRLCSDTEWTLACEGPESQPYPYGDGYVRDDQACNIDKPYIWPHPERIYNPKTREEELSRLDQREPSGARAACVSPYGVHDMVGNVDEWVENDSQGGKPFRSGLKGGYWGPVRTRCRPMTTAHDETFRYYQIGFRCCGAASAEDAPRDGALARR